MRRIVLFVITLLVAVSATGLGIWQLRRLQARRAANREAIAAQALPPLVLNREWDPTPYRRAWVTGRFAEEHEFVLRGRVVQGVPAVQILTPIRWPNRDTALLVIRGYVPAPDATNPGAVSWSEPGEVTVHGVLLPAPDRGDGDPITQNGRETWRTIDLSLMRVRLPFPVSSLYLVAEADSGSDTHTVRGASYPIRAEPPELTEGPHLSYAIQWFGIALASLAFGCFFVLRNRQSPVEYREG
jgi:surfeit locus 1 family protein